MNPPRATARLQLHRGFTLHDACAQVAYFSRLGISHLYLSPITQARAGSTHGYDVVDHTVVNPELGGMAALRELAAALKEAGMGLILDIVPNHMAAHASNPWWWSVLAEGRASPYAQWFDIDWNSPDPALRDKVLAPFLSSPYGVALDHGELALRQDPQRGGYFIEACGAAYPLALGTLNSNDAHDQVLRRYDRTTSSGRQALHELLERQHYRLSWWRTAPEEINWRRFFEISDLIGVRVERPEVFDAVHALILSLYAEGLIDGVRVDHVDGLADPGAYCRQLRAALQSRTHSSRRPYIVVEKILAADETLDPAWDMDGTTGYDFMNQVSGVLHDAASEELLTQLWTEVTGDASSPSLLRTQARHLMLQRHFPAERRALARTLHQLARLQPQTRDCTEEAIDRVLQAWLTVFPVYRTYAGDNGRSATDQHYCLASLTPARHALKQEPDGDDTPLLEQIDAWLGREQPGLVTTQAGQLRRLALRRFQQLTPPLAAKSLEDTLFYRYGRLLSRNEVGSDADAYASTPEHFWRGCLHRAQQYPHAMLATATHDHKRGEDARARLAVLSEIADLWADTVRHWLTRHAEHHTSALPHPADRYMLYQAVVAAWPMDLRPTDQTGVENLTERLLAWQRKALREAKQRSSWVSPHADYEELCAHYLRALMQAHPANAALSDIATFVQHIAPAGAINSLAQTLLRNTLPGVPDLYQGSEWWDFSLVDPDNRRPVDFQARHAALDALEAGVASTALLRNWRNGHIKQAVLTRTLALRARQPELYAYGSCAPLRVQGKRAPHILAHGRTLADQCAYAITPRLCASALAPPDSEGGILPQFAPSFWQDTRIVLPPGQVHQQLRDVLSGLIVPVQAGGELAASDVFQGWPVKLLVPA